jgi:2-polyprenyl-3-methyl-5-hydroxy-6-metoxy-1,4-benzoquinol methylase|tara:strand:+ start:2589 stop:3368 length:780 start_codon:yes stop_codon:yes gene_type:complete
MATVDEATDTHAERILTALGQDVKKHRKQWEFVFIVSSLEKLGMLTPGKRGLVFAAGTEPLISYFASLGVEIVATDMDAARAVEKGWASTNQHAGNKDGLFQENLVDRETFDKLVRYETLDMNHVDALPELHGGFDFVWSTCSLEHVGSISLGNRFVLNSMDLLKPGGVAIHTTEFTLSSLDDTLERGGTVLWRKKDLEQLRDDLIHVGYGIDDFCWHAGNDQLDYAPDVPPYQGHDHIKLTIGNHVCTSVGWISTKPK